MPNINYAMDDQDIKMKDLPPPINFDEVHSMSDIDIQNYKDDRGYNVLMLASEAGHIDIVNNLIERGEDVNHEVGNETAASLAFARGHHEVVLTLLKANSKFPHNFNHETSSDELKAFVDLSEVMHARVRGADESNKVSAEATKSFLTENIKSNSNLSHFYDINNVSLLKRAALSLMFGIYELLLTLNIFFAPHECLDEVFGQLENEDRRNFRDITLKVSPNLLSEEMMILMRNCKLGPDTPKERQSEFMNFIHEVFTILFDIPLIAIILKVVAASHEFKIVFDFKRDSVTFLDPSSEPFNEGLFYASGRIYIAAKDMLDPSIAFRTVGVIAHELCHYAIFLVYGNMAKPYRQNDLEAAERFEEITQECKRNKDDEELVNVVYSSYNKDMWHAELIVRVCHMIAFYLEEPQILNAKRTTFESLFNYFEEVCVPEMKDELSIIERKFDPFKRAEKKIRKQRRLNFILTVSLLFCSTISVLGLIYVYNPTLTWSELSDKDKNIFKNASVEFHGVDVKIRDLLADDSNFYDLLSSEEIKKGLKNEIKNLSDVIDEDFIFLKFSNMTQKLKDKFLEFEANFQGQKVSIINLVRDQKDFDLLNSSQVKEMFQGSLLKVSSATDIKTRFSVERFFINEEKEINENHYVNGRVNNNHEDIKCFKDIVKNLEQEKVFFLSCLPGEGRSTIFRFYAVKFKKLFPTKWIQFVDLKGHSKAYEKYKNLNLSIYANLEYFLSNDLLKLKGFELKVFIKLFEAGKVIFFWDRIDEVSKVYQNLMDQLTISIKNITRNFQFISVRKHRSKEFQEKLNVKAYKMVPLGEHEIFEFCIKYITFDYFEVDGNAIFEYLRKKSFDNGKIPDLEEVNEIAHKLNISDETSVKIHSAIEKSFKLLNTAKFQNNQAFTRNPLSIRFIAEMSTEQFHVKTSINLYELFKIFNPENEERNFNIVIKEN